MKKIILFLIGSTVSVSVFCQTATTDNRFDFGQNNSSFQFNPQFAQPSTGFHSQGHAGRLTNPANMFDIVTSKFNLKVPTRFNYSLMGVNFQAGLLMNSKQPKLGAGFSLTRGFNLSAGYGVNTSSLNRTGYSPFGKNQGIQISASYRLFRRK